MSDAIDKDLPAAARNGSQSRVFEIANDLFQRLAEHFSKMNKFAGAEAVNIYLWEPGIYVREQVEIPLLRQFRVVAALH